MMLICSRPRANESQTAIFVAKQCSFADIEVGFGLPWSKGQGQGPWRGLRGMARGRSPSSSRSITRGRPKLTRSRRGRSPS